jgi:hypothetical protein
MGKKHRFSTDILAMTWFAELDLDDLRQKKFKAPFLPDTSTLDTLVEKSSNHSNKNLSSVSLNSAKEWGGSDHSS